MAGTFDGFPPQTLAFLRGLARDNSRDWFEAHRGDYDEFYVGPARRFVEAIGPGLSKISPSIRYEARVNGSLLRINRDTRFSKDKTPYKAHLDLWFWEGERRGWDSPGFFFRLTPETLVLGAGMHQLAGEQLEAYRRAVLDERAGKALEKTLKDVRAAGAYTIGGVTRKTVPRGLDAKHPRAPLLLHDGLYATWEGPPPPSLSRPAFGEDCLTHFRALAPVSRWLLRHVAAV